MSQGPKRTLRDYPEILAMWHHEKNGVILHYGKHIQPHEVSAGSGRRVWWKCPVADDHEWQTAVSNRVNQRSWCPFCSNQRVSTTNSLASLNPELAKEWHPTLNGTLTPDQVVEYSSKRVWWKCHLGEDHVWNQTVSVRSSMGTGCPCCAGLKVSITNSLSSLYPDVATYWSGPFSPFRLGCHWLATSGKRVWWKCNAEVDHEWRTQVYKRTIEGQGCPCCAYPIRKVVPSNSLSTTHPQLASEWDYNRNDRRPTEYAAGSGKSVHWVCEMGHSYEATISNRSKLDNATGCPYCAGRKVLPDGSNSLAASHPHLISEWDVEANGGLTAWDVRPMTHNKAHWICSEVGCGNRWEAAISSRSSQGSGCPKCAKYGIDPSMPGYLYLNAIVNQIGDVIAYKLGVTNGGLEDRYKRQRKTLMSNYPNYEYERIGWIRYDSAKEAIDIEGALKKIDGRPIMDFDGGTELFLQNPIEIGIEMGMISRRMEHP